VTQLHREVFHPSSHTLINPSNSTISVGLNLHSQINHKIFNEAKYQVSGVLENIDHHLFIFYLCFDCSINYLSLLGIVMTSIAGAITAGAGWAMPISQAIATSAYGYSKVLPVFRGTATKGKQDYQSQHIRIAKEDLISGAGENKHFYDSKASKQDALVYEVYTKAVDPMESIRENMAPHSSSYKKKCKNVKTTSSLPPAVPKKQLKSKTGAPSSPVLKKKTVKSKAGTISFSISKEEAKKKNAPIKGEQSAPAKDTKSNAASKKEKSPPLKVGSGSDKEKMKANDKHATSALKGAAKRIVVINRNTEEINNDEICNEYETWEDPQLHEGIQTSFSNNIIHDGDNETNNITANDDKKVLQMSNNTDIVFIVYGNANDDDITLVPYNSNKVETYENDTEIRIQSHLTDTYGREQQLNDGGGYEFNDVPEDVGSYFNQLSALGFVIIVIAISATIASVFALVRHRHRRNERNVNSSDIQHIEVVDMYDLNMRHVRDKYESTAYIIK